MASGTAGAFSQWGGGPTHAIPFADSVMHRVLAAGVAENITVPGVAGDGPFIVLFNSDVPFFAQIGGTAAVPAADVTDGTASEYMPVARVVSPAQVISVIAPSAGFVQALFYKQRSA